MIEVEASSGFDAAAQATQRWALLWWYRGDAVIEVCGGEELWKVRAERVRQWNATRAKQRKALSSARREKPFNVGDHRKL
jgi:hypothetical protein